HIAILFLSRSDYELVRRIHLFCIGQDCFVVSFPCFHDFSNLSSYCIASRISSLVSRSAMDFHATKYANTASRPLDLLLRLLNLSNPNPLLMAVPKSARTADTTGVAGC